MINMSVTIKQTVDMLNGLLEMDRDAVSKLVAGRVPCNIEIANHPTVQCSTAEDGTFVVGLLGILNGLFGIDDKGYGGIYASLEDDEVGVKLTNFGIRRPWTIPADDEALLEFIAARVHDAWWEEKRSQGFHAPVDCPEAVAKGEDVNLSKFHKWCSKCHADMYPYDDLAENIKDYDRTTARVVIRILEDINHG